MAGSSTDTFPTSSDGTYGFAHVKVEDVDVTGESLIFIKDEADISIKREEISVGIPSPGIKSEPDEVSYVYVWLLLDTFYRCAEMSCVCVCVFFFFFFLSIYGQM
jgi:hypothetical protein